jgi:hypothetical protein
MHHRRSLICPLVLACALPLFAAAEDLWLPYARRGMVDRAQNYLASIHKQGTVGDSRQKMVTALAVLAGLSSGRLPDADPNAEIRLAWDAVARSSSTDFFGGPEEPNADHAVATLMWIESVGCGRDIQENLELEKRARLAMEYALRIQDKGVGAEYYGGWRRNDQTRVNDRLLTVWYLLACHSAELRGIAIPNTNTSRALEFVAASQKLRQTEDPDEMGGFSVDAFGLSVRSTTAGGLFAIALFDAGHQEAISAARDWLVRHPPRWHGPNFYETNFFAVRGLHRTRHLDDGQAFQKYFARLVQILQERQDPDGSFPFPPGHGGPTVAMGRGYSTALAILILNVDRGIIPMDK